MGSQTTLRTTSTTVTTLRGTAVRCAVTAVPPPPPDTPGNGVSPLGGPAAEVGAEELGGGCGQVLPPRAAGGCPSHGDIPGAGQDAPAPCGFSPIAVRTPLPDAAMLCLGSGQTCPGLRLFHVTAVLLEPSLAPSLPAHRLREEPVPQPSPGGRGQGATTWARSHRGRPQPWATSPLELRMGPCTSPRHLWKCHLERRA